MSHFVEEYGQTRIIPYVIPLPLSSPLPQHQSFPIYHLQIIKSFFPTLISVRHCIFDRISLSYYYYVYNKVSVFSACCQCVCVCVCVCVWGGGGGGGRFVYINPLGRRSVRKVVAYLERVCFCGKP